MKLFRGLSTLSLVVVTVSACNFLKKGGDDGGTDGATAAADEAGAATTPPPAAGAAANENDIARFPDEVKLADVPGTVRRPYNVRDTPPAGGIVAGVNPGQGVTQVATRGMYTLITFDDAKQGKKLMGWVHKDAFSPPVADAGITDPKCTVAGETALVSDNTGFCGRVCTQRSDCTSGYSCRGSAQKWDKGKAGDTVKVCVLFERSDAGTTSDAGAVTTVDSGAPAADAGGSKLAPQTVMIAPSQLGVCPDNAQLVKKDNKCHLKCPQAKICDPFKGFCGKCDGVAVCNEVRNYCGS